MNARILGPVLGFGLALATAAYADPLADRQPIDVAVVNGQVVVAEEQAVTLPTEGALVWRLTASGYEFPDSGIVIASEGRHRCGVIDKGQGFRCVKLKHVSGAKYKYTVNVVVSGSGKPLPALDPFILDH